MVNEAAMKKTCGCRNRYKARSWGFTENAIDEDDGHVFINYYYTEEAKTNVNFKTKTTSDYRLSNSAINRSSADD